MFVIATSGKVMYGYWTGLTETGEKRIGPWVLAREERDIEEAKGLLSRILLVEYCLELVRWFGTSYEGMKADQQHEWQSPTYRLVLGAWCWRVQNILWTSVRC